MVECDDLMTPRHLRFLLALFLGWLGLWAHGQTLGNDGDMGMQGSYKELSCGSNSAGIQKFVHAAKFTPSRQRRAVYSDKIGPIHNFQLM